MLFDHVRGGCLRFVELIFIIIHEAYLHPRPLFSFLIISSTGRYHNAIISLPQHLHSRTQTNSPSLHIAMALIEKHQVLPPASNVPTPGPCAPSK